MMKNLLDKDNTFGVVTDSRGLVSILVRSTTYTIHTLLILCGKPYNLARCVGKEPGYELDGIMLRPSHFNNC